jgi:hypothetical protein
MRSFAAIGLTRVPIASLLNQQAQQQALSARAPTIMNQVSQPDSLNPPQPRLGLLSSDRLVPGRTLLACVAGISLIAYLIVILQGPILRGTDTYTSFSHLYVWTQALRAGDFLSTWAPINANGFGTPLPFFYHKLFNLIGAVLALATGDLVMGYRLAVLFFAAVLFAGVYVCAGRFGADPVSRLVIAAASVLAPYMVAKAAGGVVAEYSAATLIPLVVALVLDAYAGRFRKWHGTALFVLLLLLALAHVLVFVIALAVLFPAMCFLLATSPARGWLPFAATAAASVVFVGLIYVPFSYWSSYFSSGQARIFGHIADTLIRPQDIFWRSPRSAFGWPVFALVIGMGAAVMRFQRLNNDRLRAAFALGCVVLFVFLMMTRLTRPFWHFGGPLDFIQVPWRLLSVAIPVCLVALAGLIEQFAPATKQRIQFVLLVFAIVTAVRMLTLFNAELEPMSGPELRQEVPFTGVVGGSDAAGEYYPAFYQKRLASTDLWKVSPATLLPAPRPLVEASGCIYPDIARPDYFDTLQISATCATGGHLRVNQFATPFLTSVALDAQGVAIKPLPGTQFIEFSLPAGHWTVFVRKQTYAQLIAMAWRAELSKAGL